MVWTTLDAVASGMYRRVVPLYWLDERERIYVVGSAVPFEYHGFRCLLTAAHVCFDDVGQPQPLFTIGSDDRPWALTKIRGVWQFEASRTPDVDIGVITLAPDCSEDLDSYYQFSTIQDLSSILPRSDSTYYLIAGYPSSRNRVRDSHSIASRATFFVMRDLQPLDGLQLQDKSSDCHFLLSVPAQHGRIGGGQFHLPSLQGMSGGGIWRFEIDDRTRMITTPSLVGVGIEHHKKRRTIVGTDVRVAMPLIRDLFAQSES